MSQDKKDSGIELCKIHKCVTMSIDIVTASNDTTYFYLYWIPRDVNQWLYIEVTDILAGAYKGGNINDVILLIPYTLIQ